MLLSMLLSSRLPQGLQLYTLRSILIKDPIKDKIPVAPGQTMSNSFQHKSVHFPGFLRLLGYSRRSPIRPLFKVMCEMSNLSFSISYHFSLPLPRLLSLSGTKPKFLSPRLHIFKSLHINILPLPSTPLNFTPHSLFEEVFPQSWTTCVPTM